MVGVDMSPHMVIFAMANFQHIDFHRMEMDHLEFEVSPPPPPPPPRPRRFYYTLFSSPYSINLVYLQPSVFDAVICHDTFQYVLAADSRAVRMHSALPCLSPALIPYPILPFCNPRTQVIAGFWRVLKVGGQLCMTALVAAGAESDEKAGRLSSKGTGSSSDMYEFVYTAADVKLLLTQSGFTVSDKWTVIRCGSRVCCTGYIYSL
jgi:hypothetical protein